MTLPNGTTFYSYRGTVARIVRADDSMTIAIYSGGRWIDFPGLLGPLTGLGGDPPADVISRDDARRIVAAIDARGVPT